MSHPARKFALALFLAASSLPASPLAELTGGPDYQRGFKDGSHYAHAAASARGLADGRAAGDAAGYARGLEDERARQGTAPAAGAPPPAPPADLEGTPDSGFLASLRQRALEENPKLAPGALVEPPEGSSGDAVSSPLAYTRGFGEGLAAGLAEGYIEGRKQGFEQGYLRGYERGCSEFRRLYRRADGSYLEPKAEIELGRQAALTGRYAEALQRFDVAITTEGAGAFIPEALYWKAFTCYEWSKPADALQVLNKLLTHYPDSAHRADANFLAGASYEKLPARGFDGVLGRRRYAEAIEMYRRVLDRDADAPRAPDAAFRIGYDYELLGERDKAKAALQFVLTRYPGTDAARRAQETLHRLTSALTD